MLLFLSFIAKEQVVVTFSNRDSLNTDDISPVVLSQGSVSSTVNICSNITYSSDTQLLIPLQNQSEDSSEDEAAGATESRLSHISELPSITNDYDELVPFCS